VSHRDHLSQPYGRPAACEERTDAASAVRRPSAACSAPSIANSDVRLPIEAVIGTYEDDGHLGRCYPKGRKAMRLRRPQPPSAKSPPSSLPAKGALGASHPVALLKAFTTNQNSNRLLNDDQVPPVLRLSRCVFLLANKAPPTGRCQIYTHPSAGDRRKC